MSKRAVEFQFNNTTPNVSYGSYDSSKLVLGTLMRQYTGATATDFFVSPSKIGLARPMEAATIIQSFYPHAISFSSNIDWVFMADAGTAAATRRIVMYEYNKNTSIFTWKGFITLTYPAATNHTIRGFRMSYDLYTTGTISGSSTTVLGTGTAWSTSRLAVGCRIGFGSTDPTQISTWYQISAINSNTSITLTSTLAGTLPAGTAYVIEDLRCYTTTTNATTTNGGLFVTKGLRIEDFANTGTVIPAATTVDNIKAVYWLADASTVTNVTACGCAVQGKTSWTGQTAYVLDSATVKVYGYNVRAALTLTSGKDTTTNTIKTGNQAVTGTISNTNNGRLANLNHGPGSGVDSLYFVTTTRIYRAALSNITNGSTTWQSDVMIEVPPGGSTTYAPNSALAAIEYANGIDRLLVMSTGGAGSRSYVTQYNTSSNPMDMIFLIDSKQQDQSTVSSDSVAYPNILALPMVVYELNGILYLLRSGNVAANNIIYSLPIGADNTFVSTSNQVVITPAISTSNASKLYRVYVNSVRDGLGNNQYAMSTEPYLVYARTSGIADNSGGWTLINDAGDLSGLAASTQIQFRFTFKVIGMSCVPAQIYGLTLIYEDSTTDSHYEPSVVNTNVTANTFSWRQGISWGGTIPNLQIQLYNAANNSSVLTDTVNSAALGTWQYSSNNGSTWNTWSNSADVVGNYIRYTATSLPNNIRVRALLTQA